MFSNALAGAIDVARPNQFDTLSRQIWQAHGAGHIPDEAAQSLAERLQQRRNAGGAAQGALFAMPAATDGQPRQRAWPGFIRAREQRSPDRQRSIERRRQLAASGPMPPALASQFTVGQLAVLRIVGDEVMANGVCDRSLAEIASRAGVCRKLAQNTLRMAARDGLVIVQRRPRPGRKNLTNLIRILSPEWVAWLKHGGRSERRAMSTRDAVAEQGEKKSLPRTVDFRRGLAMRESGARPAQNGNREIAERPQSG